MHANMTITLPETVYKRVKITAETMNLPVEEIVTQSVKLLLPAFEEDLPSDLQADLTTLTFLSDTRLWKIARQTMSKDKQSRLEALTNTQKHRQLKEDEQSEIQQLVQEAQHLMLMKAEAKRLLAQRGHTVFSAN